MSRTFHLRLFGEPETILIVAKSDFSAMNQMRQISKSRNQRVFSFVEVFQAPRRFDKQFAAIFR